MLFRSDSIGWHRWYDGVFSTKNCFQPVKYAASQHKTVLNETSHLTYFVPNPSNKNIHIKTFYNKPYVLNMRTDKLIEKLHSENCKPPYIQPNFSIQKNEIAYRFGKKIELASLIDGVYCKQEEDILLEQIVCGNRWFDCTRSFLATHHDKDFLVFYPDAIDKDSTDKCNFYLNARKINRKGEWITQPKTLYKSPYKGWCINGNMEVLSFFQPSKNEMTLAFSDMINLKSSISDRDYTNTIVVCKLNAKLEIIDYITLPTDFDAFRYTTFSKLHVLKNDKTYLLVALIGLELYYRVLNDDLTPKTDYVLLANDVQNTISVANPILTSEGFMITWIDNDLSENVLRSVLIDKSGKQSNIINITNNRIDNLYNIEFDKNTVDIYLFSREEKMLVRKRINKKEYAL